MRSDNSYHFLFFFQYTHSQLSLIEKQGADGVTHKTSLSTITKILIRQETPRQALSLKPYIRDSFRAALEGVDLRYDDATATYIIQRILSELRNQMTKFDFSPVDYRYLPMPLNIHVYICIYISNPTKWDG